MNSHMRGSDGSVFFARRASVRCQRLQPLVRGDLFLPSFPPGRADERRGARRPCREENEISGRPNQGLSTCLAAPSISIKATFYWRARLL
jgi:hypothetical protein